MAGHASLQVNANTSYASMLPGVNYPVQGNMESDGEDEFHDANEEESVDDSTDEEESGDDSTAEDYWDSDMVRGCLDTDLSKIKRSGKFYAWFKPSPGASNPGLEIEGLRRFGMPLQEHDIKDMIAESHRAPYGKGTETIVNEAVRKTWEIDGNRVKLRHPAWPEEFNKIVSTACGQLGVVGGVDAVEAQLYKLLIYEEGAMFKPHKEYVPPSLLLSVDAHKFQFRKSTAHVRNTGRLFAIRSHGWRTDRLVQRGATSFGHSSVRYKTADYILFCHSLWPLTFI